MNSHTVYTHARNRHRMDKHSMLTHIVCAPVCATLRSAHGTHTHNEFPRLASTCMFQFECVDIYRYEIFQIETWQQNLTKYIP